MIHEGAPIGQFDEFFQFFASLVILKIMMDQEEAYKKSIELLNELSSEHGFLASKKNVSNYKRIWTRDGIVLGLAGMLAGDENLEKTFRDTLDTLRKYQDPMTGRIPSNVSPDGKMISYGTTVGRIDATLWYAIGVMTLAKKAGEKFWKEREESVKRAMFYLECLELNGRGFIYVPQGGDWADEYINEGYVLYDEMLYYFALRLYSALADTEKKRKADRLKDMIRVNYLPDPGCLESEHVYHKTLYEKILKKYKKPLPVSYFSNHNAGFNLDTFADSLFLLSDIPEPEEKKNISEHIAKTFLEEKFPILPAFYPVIDKDSPNWDDLENNFLFEFRNEPHEYHNGGRWPLVHGFFLSSLEKEEAKKALPSFARALKDSKYTFPEYFNGETFEPRGISFLGFSAAAYVMAYSKAEKGMSLADLMKI